MEKDLILTLEEIKKKIDRTFEEKKKIKYGTEVIDLIEKYKVLVIPEHQQATYESLVKKGNELLRDQNIKDESKVNYYLRYCGAAIYDFEENIKPLNLIMKAFLLTSLLFFVLAPQYFSFILPLIFVVPIYMGLRGMRKRVLNGLMMGVSVVPMAILVATVWLRNAYLSLGNFDAYVAGLAQTYKFSIEFTRSLTIACIFLSVVMLASAVTLLVTAIKYRKMFV